MPLMEILGGIGALGGLFGGLGQANAANQANQMSREQLELMRRAQDYQFARQGQIDPIFLELLSQGLTRSRSAPRFGGAYGPGLLPLQSALRGQRQALPAPRLIGSPPPGGAGVPAPARPPIPGPEQYDPLGR